MSGAERPDLLMMGPMHPACLAAFEASCTVHRFDRLPDPARFLAETGPRIAAVATDGATGIPEAVMAALPRLGIVVSFGVGVDAIPLAAARARGIRVTNTPDVLNDAVAELTLGLMLALCRRIVAADGFVRRGDWARGGFGLTGELTGATAGILGLGRIGKEIARRLETMKMRIAWHGRTPQPDIAWPRFPDPVALAAASDWLIVIAPGTPETRGIVSREVLAALGPQGVLVNVARGSLVDEGALCDLLASGGLGGAALDVFADEPRPDPRLLAFPNVVLSPHQGSATERTRRAMADLVVANLAAHLAGAPLPTPVV